VPMAPPEQSADLRKYYSKDTKTDRLDRSGQYRPFSSFEVTSSAPGLPEDG